MRKDVPADVQPAFPPVLFIAPADHVLHFFFLELLEIFFQIVKALFRFSHSKISLDSEGIYSLWALGGWIKAESKV